MNEKELKIIKEKALENHIPIIMDDTLEYIYKLYNDRKIGSILEIGTAVGYSAICFTKLLNNEGFIDTIERNEERKGTRAYVPPEQVRRMFNSFERPLFYEGFKKIYVVKNNKPMEILVDN